MGTHLHIESKQARRRRLKLTAKVPRRKTKKKPTSVKTLLQSHFVESGLFIKDAEAFADPMGRKPSQTFRIGFQNINLLPTSARHYKSRQLANHIREGDYDIWMMNEIGLYWPKIDPPDQWEERIFGSLQDSTAVFAYNAQEPSVSEPIQYGGTGMVGTAEIKCRLQDRGRDPSGMGRWVWMRLTGKDGHHVLFVTAYRPCQSGGAGSTFQQHSRAMALQSDFRNPRTAILEDLVRSIAT